MDSLSKPCACSTCTLVRELAEKGIGRYINASYHHGVVDPELDRTAVCPCGYWECGGRGCGDCPSCYGEHCECGLFDGHIYPEDEAPTGNEYDPDVHFWPYWRAQLEDIKPEDVVIEKVVRTTIDRDDDIPF